ncbi:MAG TPA: cofactor-independent phosphoglycerate mutase [Phycisphaerae bacterium]|nr:cofactor-independent phosphoglycerate mutase [Phycisphaerae bacterium]HNU45575.1 cofactor-independent phosphoglycerate mutase [Phycisphaerae bacterium]
MKYAVILPDGAADEPLPQLEGRTPLEAAQVPNMDWVALHGRLGRAVTVPDGFIPGTDVATLTLFGYDPAKYYSGRAPLEAAARGLSARADELIFRCNFVTILDGRMKDFTAGHIAQSEVDQLIPSLNETFAGEPLRFHAGVSYRNLLILGQAQDMQVKCAPPHDIPDQPVTQHRPQGAGAERLEAIMQRAAGMLADHPVNQARRRAGRDPVTHIWLWGQGKPTRLDPFAQRFGCRGVVITAVDIIRGLGVCMGMQLIEVPGATGYIDTNYAGKRDAALAALDQYDMVVVHVEAADEAGHLGDAGEKIKALERIDEYIVGPVLQKLRRGERWRMLVAPDHPTPVSTKAHSAVPPLFAYAGTGVDAVEQLPFHDAAARLSRLFIDPGHLLMGQFIRPT